jgi:hypothetical protein
MAQLRLDALAGPPVIFDLSVPANCACARRETVFTPAGGDPGSVSRRVLCSGGSLVALRDREAILVPERPLWTAQECCPGHSEKLPVQCGSRWHHSRQRSVTGGRSGVARTRSRNNVHWPAPIYFNSRTKTSPRQSLPRVQVVAPDSDPSLPIQSEEKRKKRPSCETVPMPQVVLKFGERLVMKL